MVGREDVTWKPPYFIQHTTVMGGLLPYNNIEVMALFYYTQLAINYYRDRESPNAIIYEHDKHAAVNYHQLFGNICKMYDVKPERVIKYWNIIDKQFIHMGMNLDELLPNDEKHRHNRPLIITAN